MIGYQLMSKTFAANLRAEMGRRGLAWDDWQAGEECQLLWRWSRTEPKSPPTPSEVAALATALGCPVERLTISREDLEEQVAFWKGAARMNKEERYEHVQELISLRARVAELEALIRDADRRLNVEKLYRRLKERLRDSARGASLLLPVDLVPILRAPIKPSRITKAPVQGIKETWLTMGGDNFPTIRIPIYDLPDHQIQPQ